MDTSQIIIGIDDEIARLQAARALIAGGPNSTRTVLKRRPLSAEARKRIADAQRKRWAKVKKAAK
jgi:hypothetical protein